MDIKTLLGTIAPTLLSATLGPMAGPALALLGNVLGTKPDAEKISAAIASGQMTAEQLTAIKELELKYQAEERERGFKYAELEANDRINARNSNVAGGVQMPLFYLSLLILMVTLGTEIYVLFNGYPEKLPEIVVGRILGLMDSVAMLVLAYWYGSSSGSKAKSDLLASK